MAAAYENNLSCAVCLELYDDPRVLPCGHSYCFKCLMKMTNKSSNTSDVITCPMCQAESSFACGGQASYTKNYELNSLVQSFISESMSQDSHSEEHYCELCDQPTPAKRACVECEVTYCKKCFNTCHPMRGKFGKHNIVNADQPFKRQKVMTKYNKNMYCNDCDIILSFAGLGGHNKHDVVSLDKAHSIFKVKLEEATGNIDLMQSTLKSSLDNSKDKLKAVVSMFEEIERDVASTKAIVLSKLGADIKAAEAAIDHLLPAISTHRELTARADTISFIEECQKTIRRSSLKQDFKNVLSLFDRIDRLTCSSSAILKEVKKFEVCIIPVQKSMAQAGETEDTSSLLDNIDDTAIVHGSDSSLPSASVMMSTVTFPSLQFDHQCAGKNIRVSTDGKKIARANHAADLLGDHYPQCKNKMRYPGIVLGNPRMTAGRLYWEVEAEHAAGEMCIFVFGVTSSATPEDCESICDATSWLVRLGCDKATATIVMWHARQYLHTEKIDVTSGQLTHRHGLLLDVDQRSLSVIDVKSKKCIYVFTNVDTSHGVTSVFYVSFKCTLRLVDPDEIQRAPLLPFSTAAV